MREVCSSISETVWSCVISVLKSPRPITTIVRGFKISTIWRDRFREKSSSDRLTELGSCRHAWMLGERKKQRLSPVLLVSTSKSQIVRAAEASRQVAVAYSKLGG